jgi:hypothetical protein
MSLQRQYWLVLSLAVTGAMAASPGYLPTIGPSRLRLDSPVTIAQVSPPLPPLVTPRVSPPAVASAPPAEVKPQEAKVPEPVITQARSPLAPASVADSIMTNTIAAPAPNSAGLPTMMSLGDLNGTAILTPQTLVPYFVNRPGNTNANSAALIVPVGLSPAAPATPPSSTSVYFSPPDPGQH